MPEVAAQPYAYTFEPATTALVVIDMQRDFIEPGGFGEALGNDVSRLARRSSRPCARLLDVLPRARGSASSTPAKATAPTSSDCPPAKRLRGSPALRIGDAGPDGPHPGRRRAGQRHRARARAARPARRHRQARQGRLLRHRRSTRSCGRSGITHLLFAGVTTEVCVQTTMREANDRGYECLLVEDATESYFPEFKQATLDDDPRAGRHRRLDRALRRAARRASRPSRRC